MAVDNAQTTQDPSGSTEPAMSFRARHWMVGTNVAVMILLAAVLFCFVQWFGFKYASQARMDMTSASVNSLRDGTKDLVGGLETSVTLTSLYHTTDMDEENQKFLQAVEDLFALYQGANRSKIETASINPWKDHNERNELLQRLGKKPEFTEEASKHVELIAYFKAEYRKVQDLLEAEAEAVSNLAQTDPAFAQDPNGSVIQHAFQGLARQGAELVEEIQLALDAEIPQYTEAANAIKDQIAGMGGAKNLLGQIQEKGPKLAEADGLAADTVEFLRSAAERYKEAMAILTELEAKGSDLPTLKLSEFGRQLSQSNTIVVETEANARVLTFNDVWPVKEQGGGFNTVKKFGDHYFAGEAQVTSAILQMTATEKPAVVFARFGGTSLFTAAGFNPMQPRPQQPRYANLKKSLERLNYTVEEWDLKTSKEKPKIDPEPTGIVYVVVRPEPPPQQMPGRPPMPQGQFDEASRQAILSAIGENGRAMFLGGYAQPQGMIPIPRPYEYANYLKDTWGISMRSDVVVLTAFNFEPGKWGFRAPFSTREWAFGEHVITESIRTQPGTFPNAAPLERIETVPEGVQLMDLVIVEGSDDVWGETDMMGLQQELQKQRFSSGPGETDVAGPFPIATAATKGDQRIVVVSSEGFVLDGIAGQMSMSMGAGGIALQKANPANEPFFANCIQWLNGNEEQIGLGAVTEFAEARLEIGDGGSLTAWRWFAWAGWPAMALLAGLGAWFVRRR